MLCTDARASTAVPERVGHYLRQQVRWNKSFIRESLWVLGTFPLSANAFWLTLCEVFTWLLVSTLFADRAHRLAVHRIQSHPASGRRSHRTGGLRPQHGLPPRHPHRANPRRPTADLRARTPLRRATSLHTDAASFLVPRHAPPHPMGNTQACRSPLHTPLGNCGGAALIRHEPSTEADALETSWFAAAARESMQIADDLPVAAVGSIVMYVAVLCRVLRSVSVVRGDPHENRPEICVDHRYRATSLSTLCRPHSLIPARRETPTNYPVGHGSNPNRLSRRPDIARLRFRVAHA